MPRKDVTLTKATLDNVDSNLFKTNLRSRVGYIGDPIYKGKHFNCSQRWKRWRRQCRTVLHRS